MPRDLAWPRRSGVLLHITSLPGPYGIGDLGPNAFRFVDWLVEARQSIWNILPLNPTGWGDSPYQGLSAFAGNPLLISIDQLAADGWLQAAELVQGSASQNAVVDYGAVIPVHQSILRQAFSRFQQQATVAQRAEFDQWCRSQAAWLNAYAEFSVLKEINGGAACHDWPEDQRRRTPAAMALLGKQQSVQLEQCRFEQWQFSRQWLALKAYANSRGVQILGDIPLYISSDSSEFWAAPHLFQADEDLRLTAVAGVPPDYFSATGQLWGNPLFDWEKHQADGFRWWIERLKRAAQSYDICRIDHFRGLAAYWAVPAGQPTAVSGQWKPGPGQSFFDAVWASLPNLRLVVEDLGSTTPDMLWLRDANGLPGMAVLQFAWWDSGDLDHPFMPHNHRPNQVIYTGTHDNATTLGWWATAAESEKRLFSNYAAFREDAEAINWAMIRLALMSIAHTCIIPMQDVLGAGNDSVMNTPGTPYGNWAWRLTTEAFDDPVKHRLAQLTAMSARSPDSRPRQS